MLGLLLSMIVGGLLVGGILWVYRRTTLAHGRGMARAVQFFTQTSLLSVGVLAAGFIIPYSEWFRTSLAVFAAVSVIQAVQTVAFRALFSNPYADSALVGAFFGTDMSE